MIIEIDTEDLVTTVEYFKNFRDHIKECIADGLVEEDELSCAMDSVGELSELVAVYEKILYLELQAEKTSAILH